MSIGSLRQISEFQIKLKSKILVKFKSCYISHLTLGNNDIIKNWIDHLSLETEGQSLDNSL